MGKIKVMKAIEQVEQLNHFIENQDSLPHLFSIWKDAKLGKTCFSSSLGQEDQVLTDYIFRNSLAVDVFTLDTGRLFQETYDTLSSTVQKYKREIKCYFPNQQDVEELTVQQGVNGFYDSVKKRKTCCSVRKILPLKRALANQSVWITGLRREQSQNRSDCSIFEYDAQFEIIKFNPLLNWTHKEITNYLDDHNVPQNKLHNKGYVSIGCAPCTRAISPEEDHRAGRWWWETSQKECGLHKSNN